MQKKKRNIKLMINVNLDFVLYYSIGNMNKKIKWQSFIRLDKRI